MALIHHAKPTLTQYLDVFHTTHAKKESTPIKTKTRLRSAN